MMFLELFGGLTWLLLAGDLLVRGSVALARRAGIPPVVVGLTSSALKGYPEVAMGNVVGSNIANVLLVLGLPALFAPTLCDQQNIGWDLILMLGASALFTGFCFLGPLGPLKGVLLLVGITVVLVRAARQTSRDPAAQAAAAEELERVLGLPSRRRMIVLFLILGCVGLPLGADLMVGGAVKMAESLGVSTTVIGLSVVALGTSLPELATTVVAAYHRNADVAVGNIIGSNLFNLLAIIGVTAIVAPAPIPVPAPLLHFDLWVMLAAALALSYLVWFAGSINRWAGATLFAAYVAYMVLLFINPALRDVPA
jgi:cation:H+ antiporter